MTLKKFIMWLTAGLLIAWFVSRMVKAEYKRTHQPMFDEDSSPGKS